MKYSDILGKFELDSAAVSCEPFGNGNINSTFVVNTEGGKRYILQRVSPEAFDDVPALMENLSNVTGFLEEKAKREGSRPHVLIPVKAVGGKPYVRYEKAENCDTCEEQGGEENKSIASSYEKGMLFEEAQVGYYRMTPFAEGSISLEAPEYDEDFYECAVAFGTFVSELADFPAEKLHDIIPNFHNTPDRFRIFHETLERAKNDPELTKRVEEATSEIDFALAREAEAGKLEAMRESGELPTRVTHNDTKLNNVLLDKETRKLLYVIDLDTVMSGLAHYDYGDCIRAGAATAAEDEVDLSKMGCDMNLFEVFTRGYISACKGLTDREIETLPLGPRTIALELAVRFLTDYLDGDKYFVTRRPKHNLDRSRAQMKLVADMEAKAGQMENIVARLAAEKR